LGIFFSKVSNEVNTELNQIIESSNNTLNTLNNVQQMILDNQICFGDESSKSGKSSDCVTNLINIKNILETFDKEIKKILVN